MIRKTSAVTNDLGVSIQQQNRLTLGEESDSNPIVQEVFRESQPLISQQESILTAKFDSKVYRNTIAGSPRGTSND